MQDNINKSRANDDESYAFWLGGTDATNGALKQYDLLRTGYGTKELLSTAYETAKPSKRQPFNVDNITDALMREPLNLDIGQIFHTPQTVIVKKSKTDYINENIVKVIKSQFCVRVTCRSDMLIFHSDNQAL